MFGGFSDGTIYMFDCGEGVQRQLHRTQFRHRAIDNIFITHMHGDHVSFETNIQACASLF